MKAVVCIAVFLIVCSILGALWAFLTPPDKSPDKDD